ncbi:putative membrane protein [Salana multivorans]|uniref:Putative membrane protein n=1 Tax=Salana multivorans TaxID=120377 RepID=A0A3N2D9G9_9MICO|nr:DUF1304 domain-containing protein [Salana multivorans]ROR96436.1 putative membrane protein [Salana multivorans]
MLVAGMITAGLAAALHVYIFWLESLAWGGERANRTFGIRDAQEAEATRAFAFNQGFYNLFLAVAALVGVALVAAGNVAVGAALILAGTGSMLAAALVLLLSSPDKRRAAVSQGLLPLLAVATTLLALLL